MTTTERRRARWATAVLLALTSVVAPTAPTPASAAADDITYQWRRAARAQAYGRAIRTERTRGATVSLTFTGERVTWYTERGPNQGTARVYIDDEFVRRIDNSAAARRNRAPRGFGGLLPGTHTIRIVVDGRAGRRGSGTWVSVEAFRVGTALVGAGQATYAWATRSLARTYGGSVAVSSAPGATASATFKGKGLDWVSVAGPGYGRGSLQVDGATVLQADDRARTRRTLVKHSVGGLAHGTHTATLRVGSNPASRVVALDRFIPRTPSVRPFRGLGTWVDRWDYDLDPASVVPQMASYGVDTIYLSTARYDSERRFIDTAKIGAWLDHAAANGIEVVGWYVPAYGRYLYEDIQRTAKIARYVSPGGNRFAALGIDIEYKVEVQGEDFNRGIRAHVRRVREKIGNRYAIGAIVPSPVGMSRSPSSWTGFPWEAIGRYADVVQTMTYWSYRKDQGGCEANPLWCPGAYTRADINRANRRTGLPVHPIGGIGNRVTANEVTEYVDAIATAGGIGGGLYDYKVTKPGAWPRLAPLSL